MVQFPLILSLALSDQRVWTPDINIGRGIFTLQECMMKPAVTNERANGCS